MILFRLEATIGIVPFIEGSSLFLSLCLFLVIATLFIAVLLYMALLFVSVNGVILDIVWNSFLCNTMSGDNAPIYSRSAACRAAYTSSAGE